MPQPALQLVGADLAQWNGPEDTGAPSDPEAAVRLQCEAARLAGLAGEFALFGLRIDQIDESAWILPADQAYRTGDEATPSPANDHEANESGFAFPELPLRRFHMASTMPVRFMQAVD